jgi:hypothetical protein
MAYALAMGIEYRIDVERELVYTQTTGRITNTVMCEAEIRLANEPLFKSHFSQLADCRGVTTNLVTSEGLVKLAEITPFSHTAKRCYVITEAMAISYANIFGMRSSDSHDYYKICKDLDEAWAWLGIEPLEFPSQQ